MLNTKYRKRKSSTKIQSHIRKYLSIGSFINFKQRHFTAVKIQNYFRNYINRIKIKRKLKELIDINSRYQLLESVLEEERKELNRREKERIEQNDLIEKLLKENLELKRGNTINTFEEIQINSSQGDDYINHEIANKMEKLYLQLSEAQENLNKIKSRNKPSNRGIFRIFKDWFK